MKVLLTREWSLIGVMSNKLCFQSKLFDDEMCLVSRAKLVDRKANKVDFLSVVDGKVVHGHSERTGS